MNLSLLTEIRERIVARDETWLHEKLIEWGDKQDYFILNYNQFGPANPYNSLCRGLVLDKRGAIVSFPFHRFFNLGQAEAASVDINNADILEKLDGTLSIVSWHNNRQIFHTRRMLSTFASDFNINIKSFASQQETKFMQEIGKLVNRIEFYPDCQNYCFMFEVVTPATRIVTEYPAQRHGLYLIGMRHMTNYQEAKEDALDEIATKLKVFRPRRWATANSEKQIIEMLEEYPNDFEGFVLRDKQTGNRVKIKKKSYLERHRLLSKLSYRHLLPLFFKGERSEIEAYFPAVKQLFDSINKSYKDLVNATVEDVKEWRAKNLTRKDLALSIVNKLSKQRCHFLFKFIDYPIEKLATAVHEHLQSAAVSAAANWLQLDADKELVTIEA